MKKAFLLSLGIVIGFSLFYLTDLKKLEDTEQQIIIGEIEEESDNTEFFYQDEFSFELYTPVYSQYPELPTGCEVTSLAVILNYYGYNVDKVTLADNFLPKGKIGETNPWYSFVGNPRDEHSYGAYAPALVKTANDYLDSVNSTLEAYWVTSCDIEDLMKYVHKGYPVMIWVTMNMEQGYPSTIWNIQDEKIQWHAKEHCVVLVGYTNQHYLVVDPMVQEVCYYPKTLVELRFDELGNQGLVIY